MSKPTKDPWICPTCSKGAEAHSFADVIFCLYGGAEKVDGTPLNRQDADDLAERVFKRILD